MKKKKWFNFLMTLATLLTAIAIAGLFLDGTTLTNPILGFIPATVHTIVGWGLIALAVIEIGMKFIK